MKRNETLETFRVIDGKMSIIKLCGINVPTYVEIDFEIFLIFFLR